MQKFATPAPVSAVLDIPAGRVQFIAADRADTTVEVRPANASKGRDVKAAELVEVEYKEGVLRIEAPAAKNQYFGPSGAVEVTVQLPAGSRIEGRRPAPSSGASGGSARSPSRERAARSSWTRRRACASPPSTVTCRSAASTVPRRSARRRATSGSPSRTRHGRAEHPGR